MYQIYALALLIQILIAAGAASVAEARGRPYWLYAVVCFLLPGAGLIMVPYFLIFIRRVPAEDRRPRGIPVVGANAPAEPGRVEQLERLGRLRDDGTLTEAEFDAEKLRVLERPD